MTDPFGGFDFSLEFSETFATRLLAAVFEFGGTPVRFNYQDHGQPGLLTSHQTVGGKFAYQNYLMEIEAGYDFTLSDPEVRFIPGASQAIEIDLSFGLKLQRNLVTRIFDQTVADTPLAPDPTDVKQNVLYPEDFRTAPAADPYPGAAAPHQTGRITIRFPVVQKLFGGGRRVSAGTVGTTMRSVVLVGLDAPIDPRLTKFIETVASKALTALINNEADDYDMTPLLGDLSAYGLKMREPIAVRIGVSSGHRVLTFAANEYATVGDGNPAQLGFFASSSDFCVSFREAMFGELIDALYQDGILPRRYSLKGLPDAAGPVLIEQPRLVFSPNGLGVVVRADLTQANVAVAINAIIVFETVAAGQLHVKIKSLTVDIQFPGFGVGWLINTITFHVLSAIVGEVLASILKKPISNSLDGGLQQFLNSGALAFGFKSPIRGTQKLVEIQPTEFTFKPAICSLRGNISIA